MLSSEKCDCLLFCGASNIYGQEEYSPSEARTMPQFDLSTLLSKAPRNCWLALNEEQTIVVGRGETMEEAVKEANANGIQDPIVIWAPKTWMPVVY